MGNPEIEFWFLLRRNGLGLFGLRLTRHPDNIKSLPRGELRPELAHLLCLISEPQRNDIFLDPFAGHGAIPVERATCFPYRKILSSDNNLQMINKLRKRIRELKLDIQVEKWGALKLESLSDQSINKIVTDPPWGHFLGKGLNLEQFYTQMFDSFYRILKSQGIVVLIVEKKELMEGVINNFPDKFKLRQKLNTLVSGRKAGVYKLIKT
ncbi:methyltransferase [Patescibacteria group bacterium]|nr:methyltransferase [Patescibacteria group bacterium]